MVELETSMEVSTLSGEAIVTETTPLTAAKKKRNLPGMPDPDAEVVALSPKTLMATNRFVCEICNKGFQRDQNLQLHRRGHNLPWKLRQRVPGAEPRKRVFVCPEVGCVHHDPRRALGDLTGIKKHFCRKHGEKKWKCERCAKKYAVQSDWKAHMKTCGTREYRCDCGTMFSRRDSFITHRAFCDTLAQETARAQTLTVFNAEGNQTIQVVIPSSSSSPPPPPLTPSTAVLSPVLSIQSSEQPDHATGRIQQPSLVVTNTSTTIASGSSTSSGNNNNNNNNSIFASMFSPPEQPSHPPQSPSSFSDMLCPISNPECNLLDPPMSLSLSSSLYLSNPSLFAPTATAQEQSRHYQPPALSATALLQKAAQMGATGSSSSFLRGLGLDINSSSTPYQCHNNSNLGTMNINVKHESRSSEGGPMMGPTLDFLGLGIGSSSTSSFSALLDSISNGHHVEMYGGDLNSNEDPSERKASFL